MLNQSLKLALVKTLSENARANKQPLCTASHSTSAIDSSVQSRCHICRRCRHSMLKRRDWKLLHRHDQEGSASSSSSDEESEQISSSSNDDGGQPSIDDHAPNPMQMPSSDDEDGGDAWSSDTASSLAPNDAVAIAARWLQPHNDDEKDSGYALRCRVCPGKVLLSAASLRIHAASKKHIKGLARLLGGEVPDNDWEARASAFCISDAEEECETHEERLQRVAALAARVKGGDAVATKTSEEKQTLSASALRRERRKKKQARQASKRVRPGKRQRQAARVAG